MEGPSPPTRIIGARVTPPRNLERREIMKSLSPSGSAR